MLAIFRISDIITDIQLQKTYRFLLIGNHMLLIVSPLGVLAQSIPSSVCVATDGSLDTLIVYARSPEDEEERDLFLNMIARNLELLSLGFTYKIQGTKRHVKMEIHHGGLSVEIRSERVKCEFFTVPSGVYVTSISSNAIYATGFDLTRLRD